MEVMIVLVLMKKFCIVKLVVCCFEGRLFFINVWKGFMLMLMEVFMIYNILVVVYRVGELGIKYKVMEARIVLMRK